VPWSAPGSRSSATDGLLLLVRDPDPDYGGAIRLLHPFTGDVSELPPLGTLLLHLGPQLHVCPPQYRIRQLARVVSASVSFDAAGAMTVMLALPGVGRAAFATPPGPAMDSVELGT